MNENHIPAQKCDIIHISCAERYEHVIYVVGLKHSEIPLE